MDNRLLEIKNLKVGFKTYAGIVQAVRGVDFHLDKGETLAVVGESGCGKTVTAKAIMGLLDKDYTQIDSELSKVNFDGKNLLSLDEKGLSKVRGRQISMIFQDPMTSLNPTMKVGEQIAESIVIHHGKSMVDAKEEALEMLELVKIPNARSRLNQYPFEFSGGMRQRVMIAIALACKPEVLIADEPTTALDVTIQAQIMDLIAELQQELNMGVILVTHDLGVVASVADRIQVMYAGEIVERGEVDDIFYNPKHPYTLALLRSIPKLSAARAKALYSLVGTPPDLTNPPHGCAFAARCQFGMRVCREGEPSVYDFGSGHSSSCWLHHPMAPKEGLPDVFLEGGESGA